MTITLLIVGYLAVGWLCCLSFSERFDDDSRMFAMGLFLWPVYVLLYVFYALEFINSNLRKRLRKKTPPTP